MPMFDGKVIDMFKPGGEFEDEHITVVDTTKDIKRVLEHLWQVAKKKRPTAVDSEFDIHAPDDANPIQCWSLSTGENHKVVIPGELIEEFREWLESDAPKVWQNFMADEEVFEAAGIKLGGFHADTLIMDFMVDESDRRHDLKHAAQKWLKLRMMGKFTEVFSYVPEGKKKPVLYTWSEIWRDHQAALIIYSGDDPEKTYRLYRHHRKRLEKRGYWPVYLREDVWFTKSLINMSKRGMPVDIERMINIRTTVLIELLRATHVFKALCGKPDINLRSGPQMKKLFFEELRMPELKPTKTEKDKQLDTRTCMDAEVMERWSEMRRTHKLGASLAEVRLVSQRLNTLRGTFIEGIINGREDDGRLYSAINQIGAVTGRISSRKYTEEEEEVYYTKRGEERTRIRKMKKGANLQNLPARAIKDPYGIRGAFIASEGYMLVVVDKAGFEWWLMAHWSEDELMLKQSLEKFDPHGQTATRFYNLPCKLTDWRTTDPGYAELKKRFKAERDGGKTGNFGFIYGCQAAKAAKMLGLDTEEEGQEKLDAFFDLYSGIRDYHYRQVDMARRVGYVETISGRRIHLPEIDSDNAGVRFHEENRAKNGPIQGSAADIMKTTMNLIEFGTKLYKMYPATGDQRKVLRVKEAAERADYIRRKLKARMLIQVHDEIVWEAPEENAQEVLGHAVFIMENDRYSARMKVHLPAEGNIGRSWKDAK